MKYGLKPHKNDPRDHSFKKTFGTSRLELPSDYSTNENAKILDQGDSMFCTAFASCAVAADEDGVNYSPEWFFAQEKHVEGGNIEEGVDLRTACKTAVKCGFLNQGSTYMSLQTNDPIFLANYLNWPYYIGNKAKANSRKAFFFVDGPYDTFDNIRSSMYQNKLQKMAVLAGSSWYEEWNESQAGVIPETYSQIGGLHAFKIIGWTTLGGKEYLTIQNSYGVQIGNKGYFYMSRAVANKELKEGLYCFVPHDGAVETVGNWFDKFIYWITNL